MPAFNEVLLMGNLTRDVQLKQLNNGTACAEFGLATNRKFRTAAGEDKEEVCFVDCTAFGKQAEVIHQYCQKGRPLFVQGRLKYDTWEDKSGGKRSKLTVIVENFQFLGGKQDNDSQAEPDPHPRRRNTVGWSGGGSSPAGRPSTAAREHVDPIGDQQQFTGDDIPF